MTSIILNLPPLINISSSQFYQLCQNNPETKLELTAKGELLIMPPTGGSSGNRNRIITQILGTWTDSNNTGISFDSSTMFQLPNGAFRSPDAAWIPLSKWQNLTQEQQEGFPPICPDFVIELRSKTDSLKLLQNKMQEYIDNGTILGWLINPQNKQVFIYRQGQEVQILQNITQLQGENVLLGFVLDLSRIWV